MCGIVALVSRTAPLLPDALERAVRSLRHRGPDAAQCWQADDRRAGLGHARLSIIDRPPAPSRSLTKTALSGSW